MECREIIELAKRVSEQCEQTSKDGSPPSRRPGKETVDDGDVAAGERDLGYQSPEGVLKDVFTGDSDSGDDNDTHLYCLKKHGANWVNGLPSVLWGNQTTPSRATGDPVSS
jgi:hypothetical protein